MDTLKKIKFSPSLLLIFLSLYAVPNLTLFVYSSMSGKYPSQFLCFLLSALSGLLLNLVPVPAFTKIRKELPQFFISFLTLYLMAFILASLFFHFMMRMRTTSTYFDTVLYFVFPQRDCLIYMTAGIISFFFIMYASYLKRKLT